MAWSRTQTFTVSSQWNNTGGITCQATLTSAVAVGDVICVLTSLGGLDPSTVSSTLTDQLGNTYNRLSAAQGGKIWDATNAQGTDGWWCIVTVAGTPTITYTPNPSSSVPWIGFKGSHFTGGTSSTYRDSKGGFQATPGTGANAITTASVGAQNNDLLWAATFNDATTSSSEVAGTGFTGSTVDTTSGMLDEWLSATGAHIGSFTDATSGGTGTFATIAIAITSTAIASAAISGTVTSATTESDIVAGGKTIIITLTGDTWILP